MCLRRSGSRYVQSRNEGLTPAHAAPRIVLVNRYFYPDLSATSRMASDLALSLARAGRGVCVVTGRQRYDCAEEVLQAREHVQGVDVRRIWTTRFGRAHLLGRAIDYATFYFSAFAVLLRVVSKGDIVLAKTDPPLISIVAWAVSRLRGAQTVNWLQDLFPEVVTAIGWRADRGPMRLLVVARNRSLRDAAANVVLGERMQRRVVGNGIAPNRVHTIPNWADGSRIRPVKPTDNALRREWRLEGHFVIGYSGNLGRAHEFKTVLGAMERLHADQTTKFLFVGGGSGMDELRRQAEQADLPNCQFVGYQPDERLAESLSVPDVHLVSLRPELEGLIVPSKVYGILAAGRPVIFIGDPDGEVGVLVAANGCGYTVKVGDVDGLVQMVQRLKSDPELVATLGARSRRCFEQQYDFHHAMSCWQALLDRLFLPSAGARA